VRDLATGKDLPDMVPGTSGEVVWGTSGAFYYVEVDANHRPVRVKRHRMGSAVEKDEWSTRKRRPDSSSIST
jgi:oligopeptidase B